MADRKRVLILGGTTEAMDLANSVAPAFNVTYSLAGRTHSPALPADVTVRTGGFGGVAALSAWMLARDIDLMINATHPFAQQISANADAACRITGTPRLRLLRPAWDMLPGETWHRVEGIAAAASKVREIGKPAFLSVGRQELAAFKGLNTRKFLIRTVDPIDNPPLAGAVCITGRGPFTAEGEAALMTRHGIGVLVSKNAGGDATYGKIAAARALGLPVVMINRPPPVLGNTVDNTAHALDWLKHHEQKT